MTFKLRYNPNLVTENPHSESQKTLRNFTFVKKAKTSVAWTRLTWPHFWSTLLPKKWSHLLTLHWLESVGSNITKILFSKSTFYANSIILNKKPNWRATCTYKYFINSIRFSNSFFLSKIGPYSERLSLFRRNKCFIECL